jgi:hypothetical protein
VEFFIENMKSHFKNRNKKDLILKKTHWLIARLFEGPRGMEEAQWLECQVSGNCSCASSLSTAQH